ncbi:Lytic transglycosylase, catalytic precursor [Candidatus Methylomirabilis oxygeniifera]|uniref:Lytic transglycosylase, catalytic n=1 Tax=Methylomirabilis oxygeniifera TaxID=671143 RepID=D5MJU5_METO1|nr:Lytic transglycosylase, catalytic precursor [Candidatus Methylomirabilis oxyfera]
MGKSRYIAMVLASLVLLSVRPASGEIYFRTDEDGFVHFTNVPTTPQHRRLQPGVLPPTTKLTSANMSELINALGAEYGLDPALIRAVIQVESNFNRKAVSPKGAQGLMQLMPATIWRFSVGDAYDPHENIGAGARYLRQLLDLFRGDLTLALAAYNAGENAVLRYKGIPPYAETRDYVAKVLSLYRRGQRERHAGGPIETVAQVIAAQPPPPPPPPSIYKAEASDTILYTNIPPIVQSP